MDSNHILIDNFESIPAVRFTRRENPIQNLGPNSNLNLNSDQERSILSKIDRILAKLSFLKSFSIKIIVFDQIWPIFDGIIDIRSILIDLLIDFISKKLDLIENRYRRFDQIVGIRIDDNSTIEIDGLEIRIDDDSIRGC